MTVGITQNTAFYSGAVAQSPEADGNKESVSGAPNPAGQQTHRKAAVLLGGTSYNVNTCSPKAKDLMVNTGEYIGVDRDSDGNAGRKCETLEKTEVASKAKEVKQENKPETEHPHKFAFGSTEPKTITGEDMTRAEYIQNWEVKGLRVMADPRATGKARKSRIPRATPELLAKIKEKRAEEQKQKLHSLEGLTTAEHKVKFEQDIRCARDPWKAKTTRAATGFERKKAPEDGYELRNSKETRKKGFGSYVKEPVSLTGLRGAEFKQKIEQNFRDVDLSKDSKKKK